MLFASTDVFFLILEICKKMFQCACMMSGLQSKYKNCLMVQQPNKRQVWDKILYGLEYFLLSVNGSTF